MAGLHRLQPEKWQKRNVPRPAYACGLRAYIDHEQGWHKYCPTFRLKMCWGCRGMCSGRAGRRQRCQQPQQQRNHDHYSRNGFRFWGNRTPETNAYIFGCIPEPHRCWLIQLRKRSLKYRQSTDACEREGCYQCHQGKLDSLVTAGKLIGAECWYDVGITAPRIYVRDVCVFATNIRRSATGRHGALPDVY